MSLVQKLAAMQSRGRLEQDNDSVQTVTRSYVAAGDSADGIVEVYAENEVISDTDQSNVIEVPVVGSVKEGDTVYVTAYGTGALKQLFGYGGVGAGDRQQEEIDEAGGRVFKLSSDINRWFDLTNENGLVIGNDQSPAKSQLTENALVFAYGDTICAEVGREGFDAPQITTQLMTMGNFAWYYDTGAGTLELKKVR